MPSDQFRINDMLKPYPNFQVIIDKLSQEVVKKDTILQM